MSRLVGRLETTGEVEPELRRPSRRDGREERDDRDTDGHEERHLERGLHRSSSFVWLSADEASPAWPSISGASVVPVVVPVASVGSFWPFGCAGSATGKAERGVVSGAGLVHVLVVSPIELGGVVVVPRVMVLRIVVLRSALFHVVLVELPRDGAPEHGDRAAGACPERDTITLDVLDGPEDPCTGEDLVTRLECHQCVALGLCRALAGSHEEAVDEEEDDDQDEEEDDVPRRAAARRRRLRSSSDENGGVSGTRHLSGGPCRELPGTRPARDLSPGQAPPP